MVVEKRAEIRLPTPVLRSIIKRKLPATRTEKIDADNIRLLNAPNFGLFCRQQGVTMMRSTFGALEEAIRTQPNIHLPDLPESFFEDLLHRRGDAVDYKQRLPPEFYEFIDTA